MTKLFALFAGYFIAIAVAKAFGHDEDKPQKIKIPE